MDTPNTTATRDANERAPLRLRIPLTLLAAMVVLWRLPGWVEDPPAGVWMLGALGPPLCGLGVLLWWLFQRRASWRERLGGLVGWFVALFATGAVSDPSVVGPMMFSLSIPMGCVGFALGALIGSRRRPAMWATGAVVGAVLAFAPTTLVRSEGLRGDFQFDLYPRWVPTSESVMLAEEPSPVAESTTTATIDLSSPAWPGFRGAQRDGRTPAESTVRLSSDWSTPPQREWSIRVGPGWSSFAVAGDHLFTQEQRGAEETTTCLDARTGERVWMRAVEARFDDPLGGPGPRATPTLAGDALYVLGAAGNLARLDAATGAVRWEAQLTDVASCPPPDWGFTSSPLVANGFVIVHAGGPDDMGVLAFDVESGELAWSAPAGSHSYSSPQLERFGETDAVLMLSNRGLDILDATDGKTLLTYEWKSMQYRALQPHRVGDDILVPTEAGFGTRRLRLTTGDTWTAEELWTSRDLEGDFNDFVVLGNYAFGFDGARFTCVDLDSGRRSWKEGRYGAGQVLALRASELLLITAESGEVVLLAADPAEHRELGRFEAFDGKTWNHPVVVGNRLFVRNAEEAACFLLP